MTTTTYIIVEPSNGALDMSPAPNAYEIGELIPVARPELEGVAPVLYRLEHTERQLPRVRELAESHHRDGRPPLICCVLETEAVTDVIREHLAESLLLRKPADGSVVFRYYDPRVYAHLGSILAPGQMLTLMGPVTRWTYLDVARAWQEASFDGNGSGSLAVTDEQYEQIARLSFVRRALELLRDAGVAMSADLPRQLDTQLRKAERYGLSPEDQIPFALHGVLVAPNFDRHPQVQSALSQVRETPYVDAVGQWSDNDWQRIGQESAQYPLS
ncbi:DUF4123 domain-containing protein [Trinickia violacea]|nr:DUF4123 domain-containing protein [Trinickia violacea]